VYPARQQHAEIRRLHTLGQADWANTTVIKGDLVEEAGKLRQQGGDILMHGFGPVAMTLLTNDLLDVLHLWVHRISPASAPPVTCCSARATTPGSS
jgi:hypothetical protein